jgi:branched-chain amino acid transport system ATP-binding protein
MVILEGKNLTKCFGAIAAIDSVDFTVNRGETLGMIGPNGAGKTTLFNVIAGIHTPDRGEILFKGRSISGMKPHRICRSGIAKTSQIVQPFAQMTVLENVMVAGLHGKGLSLSRAKAEASPILDFVGIGELKDRRSGSITVSDRRRLELARVLATGAEVILLDETMAGLNATEIEQVLELLRRIQREGKTLVVVEHIMRAVMEISHRIMVLNYGKKLAEGTPEEVACNARVIEAYLGETYASHR